MCSIVGISLSVLPCIGVIFGPYLIKIMEYIGEFISLVIKYTKIIVEWLLKNVIIPLLDFMHNWGLFELMAYCLCFELVYEGS
jgi:hypothetical protein